jgi:rRNA processing protein Gar1
MILRIWGSVFGPKREPFFIVQDEKKRKGPMSIVFMKIKVVTGFWEGTITAI